MKDFMNRCWHLLAVAAVSGGMIASSIVTAITANDGRFHYPTTAWDPESGGYVTTTMINLDKVAVHFFWQSSLYGIGFFVLFMAISLIWWFIRSKPRLTTNARADYRAS